MRGQLFWRRDAIADPDYDSGAIADPDYDSGAIAVLGGDQRHQSMRTKP